MAKRLFIKTDMQDGIPSTWEVRDFEMKHNVSINEVTRLYVKFKVGKRRKLKRLRIHKDVYPCDTCGQHTYLDGVVGGKAFSREGY